MMIQTYISKISDSISTRVNTRAKPKTKSSTHNCCLCMTITYSSIRYLWYIIIYIIERNTSEFMHPSSTHQAPFNHPESNQTKSNLLKYKIPCLSQSQSSFTVLGLESLK